MSVIYNSGMSFQKGIKFPSINDKTNRTVLKDPCRL